MRRRTFLRTVGGTLGGAFATAGCLPRLVDPEDQPENPPPLARLNARPTAVPLALEGGLHEIAAPNTAGLAYVPEGPERYATLPLLLFLHGASRTIEQFVDAFRPACDAAGVMLLAPYSAFGTWDAIRNNGVFAEDVLGLNSALTWAFERVPVAPTKVAISGFSDGATYAIAMGRGNGELFQKVVAFAPGYVLPIEAQGLPPMIIAHGTNDPVLSYQYCRDVIVPSLSSLGHTVEFRSFEGQHAVPLSIATEQINSLGGKALPP